VQGRRPEILRRPIYPLDQLPQRLQTDTVACAIPVRAAGYSVLSESFSASRWYLKLRSRRHSRSCRGHIESQTDWRDETITPQTIRLLEETMLAVTTCSATRLRSSEVWKRITSLPSEIVPTGVDTDFFTPNWTDRQILDHRVLFCRALRVFKGPQVVVESCAMLPQADFIVVGDAFMGKNCVSAPNPCQPRDAWLAGANRAS